MRTIKNVKKTWAISDTRQIVSYIDWVFRAESRHATTSLSDPGHHHNEWRYIGETHTISNRPYRSSLARSCGARPLLIETLAAVPVEISSPYVHDLGCRTAAPGKHTIDILVPCVASRSVSCVQVCMAPLPLSTLWTHHGGAQGVNIATRKGNEYRNEKQNAT